MPSASTRRWVRPAALAAIVTVCALFAGAAPAFANAPNPNADTVANAVVNSDGTVTVTMSGTWSWPGQPCSGRYGEGWAVDWWGISTSQTPSPSFSLTNATEVLSAGNTTTGTISPVGAIQIHGQGGSPNLFFHVPQYYAGEVVNSASTCTDTGSGNTAGSQGSWSAQATYPSKADVPAQLCVNMYDEHGQEGKPTGNGTGNDFSPSKDSDNSIQTNNFSPSAGSCASVQIVQTIAGHIYLCQPTNGHGTPTTTEVPGGTLAVSQNNTTVIPAGSNPLAPTSVPAGTYTMTVTVPTGYHLAKDCGSTSSTQSVTVPSGGQGVGIFYVKKLNQTIAGHIYLCHNGSQTTNEITGGTLTVTQGNTTVIPTQANPVGPMAVLPGTYTVTATLPKGYQLASACGSNSLSQSVSVPDNQNVVSAFYVQ
jgi:hypothetical protein